MNKETKEIIGGYLRFIALIYTTIMVSYKSLVLTQQVINGTITDWRIIVTLAIPNSIVTIFIIVAYMKLGVATTVRDCKISLGGKIAGQELNVGYETKK